MVVLETNPISVTKKEEDLKLVEFCNIRKWYSLEENIDVEFSIDSKVKGSTFDWIGLFREDWSTFESFITFQRGLGKAVSIKSPRKRKVTFPFNKELISSILLDYSYQFVYIDRYLDVLGVSNLFKFTLPLKFLPRETKSMPLTLSEELHLSEYPEGGKSYLSSCRYQRHPLFRNTVTMCNQCRPCSHNNFALEEKVEKCYMECLRLSERMLNLETQVALSTTKLSENGCNLVQQNSDDAINKVLLTEAKIKYIDKYVPEEEFSSTSSQTKTSSNFNPLCVNNKDLQNSGSITKKELGKDGVNSKEKETTFSSSNAAESPRSFSFPPDNGKIKLNLYSNNYREARKCYSDGKLAYNDCFSLSEVDSPMILKAIIGHQEQRIRRLSQLLNETKLSEATEALDVNEGSEISSLTYRDENIVKLVRTEQRMLAQILRINNNCEEFSNEVRGVDAKAESLNCLLN